MERLVAVMLCSFACGCAFDASPQDEEGDVGEVASALRSENSLEPNGLWPNGIHPNGIHPNGLKARALNGDTLGAFELSAIQDPGVAGDLSRSLMKYVVSCALNPSQIFTFSWTDASSQVHNVVYSGSLGLAPEWQTITTELSLDKQRLISACIAARTNFYGTSVTISMRSDDHAALGADEAERSAYSRREGAFWGNLFGEIPVLYSCYDSDNRVYSRSKLRDCAAGHVDGGDPTYCGIIQSAGDCASMCLSATDVGLGYGTCNGTQYVVTTFLN